MPSGRGRARATLHLIARAAEILAEIQPASVRAVCYRLFALGVIPDMSKTSTDRVSKVLVGARERDEIPWEWIVDETREVERVAAWTGPRAIIEAAVRHYRKDMWRDQPRIVEVWSEKGTIRGSLRPVLDKYAVPFRVMHGFASATALMEIATISRYAEKPFVALYVGDWDPSGLCMSDEYMPTRIAEYGGRVTIKRIALVKRDLLKLPHFSAITKRGDSRFRSFVTNHGSRCYELDALPPPVLRDRVENHIRCLLDRDRWDADSALEKVERESMEMLPDALSKLLPAENCS